MKRLCLRVIQLAVVSCLAILATPRQAPASEFGCYVICAYDDVECILRTGHPADPCSYDAEHNICNLGGCTLGPYVL